MVRTGNNRSRPQILGQGQKNDPGVGVNELKKNTYLWLFLNLGVFFAAQKKNHFLILWHYPGNTCICNKFFYNRDYILVYTSI